MPPDESFPWPEWRRWFAACGAAFGALFALLCAVQITVDPYGVWHTQTIEGWTDWRGDARGVERLFKPYEVARMKPEAVWHGTSRTGYCIPARWPGVDDSRVYNLAINAAHLPEMAQFVRFSLRFHPRVVLIGVDWMQFHKEVELLDPVVPERLSWVGRGLPARALFGVRETVLSLSALQASGTSLQMSRERSGAPFFLRGYKRAVGQSQLSKSEFIDRLFSYTQSYRGVTTRQDQLRAFARLVAQVRATGAEVRVFVAPSHADLLMSIHAAPGQWDVFERWKRSLAAIAPTYDFDTVSPQAADREQWVDAVHCLEPLGTKLIERISEPLPLADPLAPFGALMTPETIDAHLVNQREALDRYILDNQRLYDILSSKIWTDADAGRFTRRVHAAMRW